MSDTANETASAPGRDVSGADMAHEAVADDAGHGYTESSYKSVSWHYRHGVAYGVMFIFAFFLLLLRGVWGGFAGFVNSIAACWQNDIKPLFEKK